MKTATLPNFIRLSARGVDRRGELLVDNFAGGGGASTGIELALGRSVDIAINHDREAIEMHARNHPQTKHLCEDVWAVDPKEVCGGRQVGLAWFSPDCKHFSRAKGSKPVSKKIRGLAWVAVKWAKAVRPRIIMLENVREFQEWGPLQPDNMPCPKRKGQTFQRFVAMLRNLGYQVEWKVLNAAEYGAPTHRRRLFIVARRDGQPIVWPEPTHGHLENTDGNAEGPGCRDRSYRAGIERNQRVANEVRDDGGESDPQASRATVPVGRSQRPVGGKKSVEGRGAGPQGLKPYRTASECIDWSIPCPSIFERKRPLAEKTLRRIAMGLRKYVLENPEPFIVRVQHGGDEFRGQPVDKPLGTITQKHGYGVVAPYVAKFRGESPGTSAAEPLHTITKHYGGVVGHGTDRPLADYVLPKSASAAVAKIGNSVAPLVAAALVRANMSTAKAERGVA